jgi:adhesin HecA-like repeat protein
VEQLDALAKQLDSDAGTVTGRDAARLQALATTLKNRAAKLR